MTNECSFLTNGDRVMSEKRTKVTEEVLEKVLEIVLIQMNHYQELLDKTKLDTKQMDQILMLLDVLGIEEIQPDFDFSDLFNDDDDEEEEEDL